MQGGSNNINITISAPSTTGSNGATPSTSPPALVSLSATLLKYSYGFGSSNGSAADYDQNEEVDHAAAEEERQLQQRISSRRKRALMKIIARTAIENNGMVFGGYVRDSVRNDELQRQQLLVLNEPQEETPPRASDKDMSKEPVESADIDIFLQSEYLSDFVLELKLNNICFRRLPPTTVVSEYLPPHTAFPHTSDFVHRRYLATLDSSFWTRARDRFPVELDINAMVDQCEAIAPVAVDVITSDVEARSPFVTVPDFECNALFVDKYGLQICSEIVDRDSGDVCIDDILAPFRKINQVIKDIADGNARLIHTSRPRYGMPVRAQRVLSRKPKWSIIDQSICTVYDPAYDGYCLMCHDTLPAQHLKFMCCDGRYHAKCMKRLLAAVDMTASTSSSGMVHHRSMTCPLCRSTLELFGNHNDLLPCLLAHLGEEDIVTNTIVNDGEEL